MNGRNIKQMVELVQYGITIPIEYDIWKRGMFFAILELIIGLVK
jgi:hypothetical protein